MRDTTEPFFRTLVTYEVLTHREAFNGDAEYLAAEVADGTASAKLVLRAVENLLPASVVEKLAQHDQDPDFFGGALPEHVCDLRTDGAGDVYIRPRSMCPACKAEPEALQRIVTLTVDGPSSEGTFTSVHATEADAIESLRGRFFDDDAEAPEDHADLVQYACDSGYIIHIAQHDMPTA